ncbi:MAG: Gx transporter family protein [Calditrichaeota bacterium]|nr:Gx transporter family protein [Calditrichota bacterium]
MLSLNSAASATQNARFTKIALFIGVGLILFVFEALIPRPLPWMKLGFAHVATLLALYLLDSRAAIIVVVGRIFLGSILLGSFFNPTFILSFAGGLGATLVMICAKNKFSGTFSIFGVSILGAVTHNLTQLIVANWLIINKKEVFYLIPVMTLTAIVTGMIVAFVSRLLINRFDNFPALNSSHDAK